jgi:hypothetical protein
VPGKLIKVAKRRLFPATNEARDAEICHRSSSQSQVLSRHRLGAWPSGPIGAAACPRGPC